MEFFQHQTQLQTWSQSILRDRAVQEVRFYLGERKIHDVFQMWSPILIFCFCSGNFGQTVIKGLVSLRACLCTSIMSIFFQSLCTCSLIVCCFGFLVVVDSDVSVDNTCLYLNNRSVIHPVKLDVLPLIPKRFNNS